MMGSNGRSYHGLVYDEKIPTPMLCLKNLSIMVQDHYNTSSFCSLLLQATLIEMVPLRSTSTYNGSIKKKTPYMAI